MLGLRKNITQGSLWFAITTLSMMGIVRCHSQAQRIQTLTELHAPQYLPPIQTRNTKRFYSKKWNRDSLHQQSKIALNDWLKNAKHPKPLSNRLAFALLLELRKTQNSKIPLQNLQKDLSQHIHYKNPFPANISINDIDSAGLDDLPGIGPATARKILKFRERLGGFYSTSQLIEIPKIDTLLIETLSKQIRINPSKLIALNTNVDFKRLYKHPYIGPSKAKILGPFFTQHPNLTKEMWGNMQGLTAEEKLKIAPYLQFVN